MNLDNVSQAYSIQRTMLRYDARGDLVRDVMEDWHRNPNQLGEQMGS